MKGFTWESQPVSNPDKAGQHDLSTIKGGFRHIDWVSRVTTSEEDLKKSFAQLNLN